jgi:hypothetical protein
MSESHLFEYAVIRVVPRVEREEFLNVGVMLFCKPQNFLQMRYTLNEQKLAIFCKSLDLEELKQNLSAFERICRGGKDGGDIGKLSQAERFRWLTATRSTVVQASKVHPGLCTDAGEMLSRLYTQLVD